MARPGRSKASDRTLAAPFDKAVASSRAYFLVKSSRSAGKPEVAEFAAWLPEETGKDTVPFAPAKPAPRKR